MPRIVREQLSAAGIPHNGPGVRRLADTLAGRTLRALLALDATNFSRDAVIDLVSGAPLVVRGSLVPATAWDRISREAGVDRWHRRLVDASSSDTVRCWQSDATTLEADDASPGALAVCDTPDRHARRSSTVSFARSPRSLASDVRPRTWRGLAQWADELSGALLQVRDGWPAREVDAMHRVRDVLTRRRWPRRHPARPELHRVRRRVDSELDEIADHVGWFGDGVFFGPTTTRSGSRLSMRSSSWALPKVSVLPRVVKTRSCPTATGSAR